MNSSDQLSPSSAEREGVAGVRKKHHLSFVRTGSIFLTFRSLAPPSTRKKGWRIFRTSWFGRPKERRRRVVGWLELMRNSLIKTRITPSLRSAPRLCTGVMVFNVNQANVVAQLELLVLLLLLLGAALFCYFYFFFFAISRFHNIYCYFALTLAYDSMKRHNVTTRQCEEFFQWAAVWNCCQRGINARCLVLELLLNPSIRSWNWQ